MVSYDNLRSLGTGRPTLVADFAGNRELSKDLRAHLGETLFHEVAIGVTNQQAAAIGTLADTGPRMFFAPEQMRKRICDWGREGLEKAFGESWRAFAPVVEDWVDVVVGPDDLQRVWRAVQAGRTAPREGHVLKF